MSRPRFHVPLMILCMAAMLAATAAVAHEGHDHKAATASTAKADAKTDAKAAATQADAKHQAMMDQMMTLGMPGPAHAMLKSLEGKWKASVKSWNGPGDPVASEGTSEQTMMLGGRFLEQKFKGKFMDQPFEGYGLTGYDNQKGEYVMLWVDNMGTSMMTGAGTMDDATKTLTMKSNAMGPDGKPMEMRLVTKIVDDKTHVFSMYAPMEGKEALMMEITYKK